MESRLTGFAQSSVKYQQALEALQQAYKNKVKGIERVKLEQTVQARHSALNAKFQLELNKYTGAAKAGRRGTVWSNPQRAINLAKSARNSVPIDLSSTRAFELVKRFEKVANRGGKGLIAFDAGVRGYSVYQDYEAGNNWQRSAVLEVTGFGAATAAGIYVGTEVVASMLGVAMFATPVGWFFVIGLGLAAGYAAATGGDIAGKWVANKAYSISERIN